MAKPKKSDPTDPKRISEVLEAVEQLWRAKPDEALLWVLFQAAEAETLGDFVGYTDDAMLLSGIREQLAAVQAAPPTP